MKFVSRTWSITSKSSRGPALLHKLKHNKSKIKAKVEAVERVVFHQNIASKPKTLAKAGVVWSQVEILRCEYEGILDEAFGTMCDSEALKDAVAGEDEQWEWLTKIETKLEELMLLKESPEKQFDETKELLDKTTKGPDDPINNAFLEQQNKHRAGQDADMKKYMEFIKNNMHNPAAVAAAAAGAQSQTKPVSANDRFGYREFQLQ